MNNVDMLLQVLPTQGLIGHSKQALRETANPFQGILNEKENAALPVTVGQEHPAMPSKEAVYTMLNVDEIPEELHHLLFNNHTEDTHVLDERHEEETAIIKLSEPELESLSEELKPYVNQITSSKQVMTNGAEDVETDTKVNENPFLLRDFIPNPIKTTFNTYGMTEIEKYKDFYQKQFTSMIAQAEELLSNVVTREDVRKASPKMLELLQQWQDLSKGSLHHSQSQMLDKNQGSSELGIWKSVLETFQKREHFAGKQLYNADSKVTVTDVSKWIVKAMEVDKASNVPVTLNTAMPITKLEQFVIYMNQSQNIQSPDEQLMEQFQKIMNANKLSTLPNGANQLSIALRPDNLGEMMVRFTQINGEITVKILVTSAVAKEMLESNMHQLRNMFSPHQVVIERQDPTVQSANTQKEQENGQLKDQTQQQSGESDQKDNQGSDNSFELQFEEMLMNEKV
ncbi:flagellar hook-length control protein FliK [Oceanobacillus saliphilus]|uniref:flagellar hook-length control protein FliK n=1 Tax=Oceanobacillus saliphilus TaxID=2925834 RepID=UPI00201E6DC5|nr:flagellar hook-length control protein FliK [Oceanobacillus saliphilus]